jgi:cytochrome c oxidase cbb3-type subunit 1
MMSAGVAASIMAIIPVLSIVLNLHLTLHGNYAAMSWSPTLRFTVFGLYGFLFSGVLATLLALPVFNAVLQFSDVIAGASLLSLYGFVSMTFFGAIYYIVPRLINAEWPCVQLIRWHFWFALSGLLLAFSCLLLGGLLQGFSQYDVASTFRSSIEFVAPFRLMTALSTGLMVLAHLSFALLFVLMLLKTGKSQSGPALLNEPTENSLETLAV